MITRSYVIHFALLGALVISASPSVIADSFQSSTDRIDTTALPKDLQVRVTMMDKGSTQPISIIKKDKQKKYHHVYLKSTHYKDHIQFEIPPGVWTVKFPTSCKGVYLDFPEGTRFEFKPGTITVHPETHDSNSPFYFNISSKDTGIIKNNNLLTIKMENN